MPTERQLSATYTRQVLQFLSIFISLYLSSCLHNRFFLRKRGVKRNQNNFEKMKMFKAKRKNEKDKNP